MPLSKRHRRGGPKATVWRARSWALDITFVGETLADHHELEVFTGVVFKDRTMSMGVKVWAAITAARSDPRRCSTSRPSRPGVTERGGRSEVVLRMKGVTDAMRRAGVEPERAQDTGRPEALHGGWAR